MTTKKLDWATKAAVRMEPNVFVLTNDGSKVPRDVATMFLARALRAAFRRGAKEERGAIAKALHCDAETESKHGSSDAAEYGHRLAEYVFTRKGGKS